MDAVRSTPTAAKLEIAGRGMILLGAFASFVLSVSLWFAGHHDQGILSASGFPRSSPSAA